MELKDRIQLILNERQLRQKDLAAALKVTDSYVSNLLSGKRHNLSEALALLLEQLYGYSARWVLTGEGERRASKAGDPGLSPAQRRLIARVETLSQPELDAVNAFIDSMEGYKRRG